MTLDTNILIAYLAGEETIVASLSAWRMRGRVLFVPAIAEAEVLSFKKLTVAELAVIEEFLTENFTSIPFDRTVARIAAELRRATPIKFPDAAIAATALYTNTPLITRDKQFAKIRGLVTMRI